MLSYRHAYHAGNHADVLKHIVQIEILSYLLRSEKPLMYIDTHAGAGRYNLAQAPSATQGEFTDGVGRLWASPSLPEPVQRYRDLVRTFNAAGQLTCYPGSPAIAQALLREVDRMALYELHSTDFRSLAELEKGPGARCRVHKEDGFAGLKSLLPPATRRAMVMIDPSYELGSDYKQVVNALRDARRRFANGVYVIWYPRLVKHDADRLPSRLQAAAGERWLDVRLNVRARGDKTSGLFGSGMFVINPPYTLPQALEATMPYLAEQLAFDAHARYTLDFRIP